MLGVFSRVDRKLVFIEFRSKYKDKAQAMDGVLAEYSRLKKFCLKVPVLLCWRFKMPGPQGQRWFDCSYRAVSAEIFEVSVLDYLFQKFQLFITVTDYVIVFICPCKFLSTLEYSRIVSVQTYNYMNSVFRTIKHS